MRAYIKDLLPVSLMLAGAVLLTPGDSRAGGDLGVTVTITGEVVVPPCTVNGGGPLEVNFGNIPVSDIGNAAFRQTQSVAVTCTYYQGTPYVKVTGTVLTGAADNVLVTNVTNFGIALYQGDGVSTPMRLGAGTGNNGYPVTRGLGGAAASNTFTFTAAPYKKSGAADPEAKAFSATAGMSIIYM